MQYIGRCNCISERLILSLLVACGASKKAWNSWIHVPRSGETSGRSTQGTSRLGFLFLSRLPLPSAIRVVAVVADSGQTHLLHQVTTFGPHPLGNAESIVVTQ